MAAVYDLAEIYEYADIHDNARVYGQASVKGNSRIGGSAHISGKADIGGKASIRGAVRVYGYARICGEVDIRSNAIISEYADISQNSHVLTVGQIGSRNDLTTFFRDRCGSIMVSCGCFLGTLERFRKQVEQTHGSSKHGRIYEMACDMALIQINDGQDAGKDMSIGN